jgi:hypothetical protein
MPTPAGVPLRPAEAGSDPAEAGPAGMVPNRAKTDAKEASPLESKQAPATEEVPPGSEKPRPIVPAESPAPPPSNRKDTAMDTKDRIRDSDVVLSAGADRSSREQPAVNFRIASGGRWETGTGPSPRSATPAAPRTVTGDPPVVCVGWNAGNRDCPSAGTLLAPDLFTHRPLDR